MQLAQLAYFVAVAETRHFTRAAARVRVAQPSLSKQIQGLERELGAPLFSRARGHVALTAAGEALLPLARRILSDVESARAEVQELAGLRRGRVRLGATPSLCTGLVADALRHFRDAYPGIELYVHEGGSRDLVRHLAGGAIDLALIILPLQQRDPALVTQPILREALMLASAARAADQVAGPAAPASAGRAGGARRGASARGGAAAPAEQPAPAPVSVADLRDRPLVMFREGYDLRDTTLAACRRAGFEPRFAVEGGEMDAVLRFVGAGLGDAVVPSMVLTGRSGLVGAPVAGPSRTIALAHRRDVAPPRAVEAFRRTLLGLLSRDGVLPPGVANIFAVQSTP